MICMDDIKVGDKIGGALLILSALEFSVRLRLCSEGAFGVVYKGQLWGQDVALKKLRVREDARLSDGEERPSHSPQPWTIRCRNP